MASVKATQEVLDMVTAMNLGKKGGKAAYLIFKIAKNEETGSEEIVLDKKGEYEADKKKAEEMMECLDDEDCRYVLLDYWHMKGDIVKSSLQLINWVPDNAPTMPKKAAKAGKTPKTVYGANFEAFSEALPCQCSKKQCTDIADITEFLAESGEEQEAQ